MKNLILLMLIFVGLVSRCQCTYNYTTANFPANLNISAGETLCITQDVTTASGTVNIYNSGTIIINDGVTFTVDGALNNFGKIHLEGSNASLYINGSYNGNGYNDCDILRFCSSCNNVNINSAIPVDLGYFKTTASASWVDICIHSPLPVELLSMSIDCKDKTINWSTGAEINNSHFTIEYSIDGYSNWKSRGVVKGKGNTSRVSVYEYPITQNGYYRLYQTDYDGTNEQFDILYCANIEGTLDVTLVATYNVLGQVISNDTRGLVIELYSDGTSKTILK